MSTKLFWASLIVVLALSLAPASPELPTTGWDKSNHLVAFCYLLILGKSSYPSRTLAVFVGLVGYGVLIEILQSFTTYRFAEWGDLVADIAGLSVGLLLDGVIGRYLSSPHQAKRR